MQHTPGVRAVLVGVAVVMTLTAAGIGGGTSAVPADTEVTSAGSNDIVEVTECREITEPGYYRLASDLLNRSENRCIEIFSSHVVFDGAGHRIDGVGKYLFDDDGNRPSTKAIAVESSPDPLTNVTIKDVVASDYGYGLWLGETSDSRVVDNTFRDNGIYGLYLGYEAHNNTIARNRVINTTSPGLDLSGQAIVAANMANRNEIVDNYVRNSEYFGIAVHLGNRTLIANNTVIDSGRHGITGVGEATVIRKNVIERSAEAGIDYKSADDTRIIGNVIRDNGGPGIQLVGGRWASRNVSIVDNRITANGGAGIVLPAENDDSEIRGNLISDNGDHGIRLVDNRGNAIVNNTIRGHGTGVRLFQEGGHRLVGNTIADNVHWDIDSAEQTTAFTVEAGTLGDDTTVSFTGRNIAVSTGSGLPAALPERTRAIGPSVQVRTRAGGVSWINVTLPYDRADVDESHAVGLWIHDGEWTRRHSADVDGTSSTVTTNLTGLDDSLHLVIAVSPEPTPSPTSTPTPTATATASSSPIRTTTPGQSGFGIVAALLSLLAMGGLARSSRE